MKSWLPKFTFAATFLLGMSLLSGCNQAPPTTGADITTANGAPATTQSSPAEEVAAPKTAAETTKDKDNQVTDKYHGLTPFRGVNAPEITKVTNIVFQTDLGDIEIEVYPEAAPNAAKRFTELVQAGFYDNTPIFRIVPGFVAQFGINWRPGQKEWQNKNFNDDPSLFELGPATLAFAKAGPNTNSTQVFINYGRNNALKDQGGFSTFGRIVKGYELTLKFKAVGDPSMGLDQGQLWYNGDAYLKSLGQNQPNMILKATVK